MAAVSWPIGRGERADPQGVSGLIWRDSARGSAGSQQAAQAGVNALIWEESAD